MDPLVVVVVVLAVVNWWRTARSRRLRSAGLCERCGMKPVVAKRFDFVAGIGVCEACLRAVSSFGGIDARVFRAGVGALCGMGAFGAAWTVLGLSDRLQLPALAVGCALGVLFAEARRQV